MNRRIERRLSLTYADLDLRRTRESMKAQLLVVHDEGDAEVGRVHADAVAAAWPGARRLTTRGLGHYRIMRDPQVVEQVVAFIAGGAAPAAS